MNPTIERPALNGLATGSVHTVTVPPPRRRRWLAPLAGLIAIALVVSGILVYRGTATSTATYATVPLARQTLVQSVTATGTVNPQNTISVGTQQSGTVSAIYVDFNSKVHKGQVLARIDDTSLRAALASAQAALAQAQNQAQAARANAGGSASTIGSADASAAAAIANARAAQATAQSSSAGVASADANVTKAQSAFALAQQTVSRDQSLVTQGYIAQNQVDTDRANAVAAQAALSGAQVAAAQARSQAQAAAAQAQASLAQTAAQNASTQTARAQAAGTQASAAASAAGIGIQEAAVQQAQTNLERAVITSPVDGTVIARSVSVGQTVAASFQTPTLFSIAQDLSKMEVDLSVGEPDIGNVRPGERVSFTVLAYPDATFSGTVSEVRKAPTTVSNVVTYTTVVLVDNKDQKLLPGMTANATIAVAQRPNALVVPVAALSYAPAGAGAGGGRGKRGTGRTPANGSPASANGPASAGSPWGSTTGSAAATVSAGSRGRIFVERNGTLVRVPVRIDLISGAQAAVTVRPGAKQTLSPGDAVVVGDGGAGAGAAKARGASSNPFSPSRPPRVPHG